MSYEGYKQLICETGHIVNIDCHDDDPQACRICGAVFTHSKSIDMTNGYEPENPYTHEGAREVIGVEEVVTERLLYRPVGNLWSECTPTPKERSE